MKKKQLFLLLPAIALLAGCGNDGEGAVDSLTRDYKEIEPAQAIQRANGIEEKISAEDYELPTKATYHGIARGNGSDGKTTQVEINAAFDLDAQAPYFYVNTVTESTTVSLWTYVDDGKCYMVADYGGNKSYAISEASDALESGENMFGYAGLTLQSIVNSAKQMASTIASFAKSVSADISMPDGVSLDYTFKANGAGDLSLDATTKTPSSDAYVGVVFKDYLLVYAETKATATIDSVTSSQYSLIEIDWNNAVHNLPDLSQYTLSSTGA